MNDNLLALLFALLACLAQWTVFFWFLPR